MTDACRWDDVVLTDDERETCYAQVVDAILAGNTNHRTITDATGIDHHVLNHVLVQLKKLGIVKTEGSQWKVCQ